VVVFNHILFATDFSRPATHAARAARAVVDAYGAKVTLMHVVDRDDSDEVRNDPEARLDELQASHFGDVDAVTRRIMEHDHADIAICGEAMANGVDLIVAGRHGEQTIAEHLLGSTTERVARHAPCSVLVVHAEDDTESFAQRVLACSDLSASSERAVEEAGELAQRFSGTLTLASVYTVEAPPFAYDKGEPRKNSRMEEVIRERLEALSGKKLGEQAADIEVVEHDSAVAAICDLAEARKSDLIVVGTQGRSGLARLLIGSVAERVVRHAPCSVLVARR
jgi:nucleotide-binding universal stress UspA family protein